MTGRQSLVYGGYDGYEVLSALRKTIKLGDTAQAVYWANVVLEYAGQATVAKQLWIVAAEDVDEPQIVLRAFAVYQMAGKVPETDHVFALVAAMCRARKWWETAEGRELDRLWSQAIGDLREPERRREIPTYALDRHTRRGWHRWRAGFGFDDRFSGTGVGRAKTAYLWGRDGRLDPDAQLDDGFLSFWQERRDLEAMGGPDVDEPGYEPDETEEPPLW